MPSGEQIPITEMAKSMWRQILAASMNYDRSLCAQIILGLFSSGILEQISRLLPNETQDFLNVCQAVRDRIISVPLDVIDLTQLIDAQVPKHRKIERYLKILVQHTGILPQYLFISNTKRQGANPLMGGGFADVWRGELNQQLVALKVLRIFEQGERRRKILQVCSIFYGKLVISNVNPGFLQRGNDMEATQSRKCSTLLWG